MEQLFENFGIIVFVIIMILSYLPRLFKKEDSDGPQPARQRRPAQSAPPSRQAPQHTAIEDEIRRKIQARKEGQSNPVAPPPLTTNQSPGRQTIAYDESARRRTTDTMASLVDQKRRVEETARELDRARRRFPKARTGAYDISLPVKRNSNPLGRALRQSLGNPSTARQAIVLHEILGAPLALRDHDQQTRFWQ